MEKKQNRLNQSLSQDTDQEVLEISSTGYGLESVSKKTEEEHLPKGNKKENTSCGGL